MLNLFLITQGIEIKMAQPEATQIPELSPDTLASDAAATALVNIMRSGGLPLPTDS